MTKWLLMATGSIAAFVIFFFVTQVIFADVIRDPPPGDHVGIKLAYSEDLPISGIDLSVDTTEKKSNIRFELVTDVEDRQENALIILILPYSGIIQENSGWKWRPFNNSTLFVKDLNCTSANPCRFTDDTQWIAFDLDKPIDSKQSAHHSVRLWFSESSPFLDTVVADLVRQFNHTKSYNTGFDELTRAKATVIIDKSTDNRVRHPDAPDVQGPEDDVQIDWEIQSGILHQIDYEVPRERDHASKMTISTAMFGILLGIINLSIFAIEQRKRKSEEVVQKKITHEEVNEKSKDSLVNHDNMAFCNKHEREYDMAFGCPECKKGYEN